MVVVPVLVFAIERELHASQKPSLVLREELETIRKEEGPIQTMGPPANNRIKLPPTNETLGASLKSRFRQWVHRASSKVAARGWSCQASGSVCGHCPEKLFEQSQTVMNGSTFISLHLLTTLFSLTFQNHWRSVNPISNVMQVGMNLETFSTILKNRPLWNTSQARSFWQSWTSAMRSR